MFNKINEVTDAVANRVPAYTRGVLNNFFNPKLGIYSCENDEMQCTF